MRTIASYPFVADESVAGRCCHIVYRLGREESCYRPATHHVAGVGLCRAHYGHYLFWQRGGRVGTPEEMFVHLVAEGAAVAPFVDARSGRATGETVRVADGWALHARRGARLGYAGLARHRAADGAWSYRLEWPRDGRGRRAFRRISADQELVLDVIELEGGDADQ